MTLLAPPPTLDPIAAQTLPARFAQQLALHPHRLAVHTPTHAWTYTDLHAASEKIAAALAQHPGTSPIALCLPHDAPLIAAILAIWKSARPLVALDPSDSPARQLAILHASHAQLLLLENSQTPFEKPPSLTLLNIHQILSQNVRTHTVPHPPIHPHTPACIVFTSGSTGTPKGVCHSHFGLLRQCDNYASLAQITPADRLSLLHSLSVAASLSALCGSLFNGATLLPHSLRHHGLATLPHWIAKEKITILHCVPTLFRQLLRTAPQSLSSLRLLRLGGETILPTDIHLFRKHAPATCHLCVALSSAETGAICMCLYTHHDKIDTPRIALGPPLPETSITLLDDHDLPVSEATTGRLRVTAPQLALGYWHTETATITPFPSDPHTPTSPTFDTQDLARFTDDLQLQHCGRADSQFKLLGHRVDPAEIESALTALPGIHHAFVLLQNAPEQCAEPALIAYLAGPSLPSDGTIRRALRSHLPPHMIPRHILPLKEFPLLPSGKVDRNALSKLPIPTAPHTPTRLPARDPLEKKLAAIFQSILAPASLGRQDDLFTHLGASSLQAAEILASIHRTLGISLPPSALLHAPTIETLSAHLASDLLPTSASPLLLLKPAQGTPRPPLFVFHGGHGGLYAYRHLTDHLAPTQLVYGLQCAGLHGEAWPKSSLSAMARLYIHELKKSQPLGPYSLIGTCMGGLIALETAQQLLSQGDSVHLLALIETTDPRLSPNRTHLRRLTDRTAHAFRLLRWLAAWSADKLTAHRLRLTQGPGFRRFVANVNTFARRTYRPLPYAGSVHLFLAQHGHSPADLERRLSLGRLSALPPQIHRIPATLDDILTSPAVETLAQKLQALLDAPQTPQPRTP